MANPLKAALVFVVFLTCAAANDVYAAIDISFTDSGWYDDTGFHSSANKNYIVAANGNGNYRDYLVFDLSSVTDPIVSATLTLENPEFFNGITSTFTLFDVSTSIPALMANQSGATGLGIYADLGTGTSYGSIVVDGSFSPGNAQISLNAAAIAALNSATGLIAFGGMLQASGYTEAFGYSGNSGDIRLLSLTIETGPAVPEPASLIVWSLLGLTIGGSSWWRRKRSA